MATSTLTTTSTYTRTDGLQPDLQTPVDTPEFTTSLPTQVLQQELLLPAAGTAVTLPIPSSWTQVVQVHIVNTDTTGYVTLRTNATTGAPDFALAPQGGTFACSIWPTTVSGGITPTPTTWTLRSMSSDGTTAGASTTNCYLFLAGY